VLAVWVCIFLKEKAVCKMLVKLTEVVVNKEKFLCSQRYMLNDICHGEADLTKRVYTCCFYLCVFSIVLHLLRAYLG